MANIVVEVPDDLIAKLNGPRGAPEETLRRWTAFSLCSRGELSTSQAARLAGLTYGEFLTAAAQAEVELFPVDFDEIEEAIARGKALGCQRVAGDPPGPGGAT